MSGTNNLDNWTTQQKKYIEFLGRGKRNKQGVKRTNEQFAQAIGVHWTTLYDWKRLSGFKYAVLEAAIVENMDEIPELVKVHLGKAKGQQMYYVDAKGKKRELKPDVQAYNAVMKTLGLVQDRMDVTTDGKALPQPIMPVDVLRKGGDAPPVAN